MKKIFLIISFLIIAVSVNAQTRFNYSVADSGTAGSSWTWKTFPKGVNAIEIQNAGTSTLEIAFHQREISISRKVFKGQTRFYYYKESDSIGFKGSGKFYFWIDKGEGVPTAISKNGNDTSTISISNLPSTFDWSKARWDSLYAMLATLNKQNGTDTVYVKNPVDTISFADTLTINDTLGVRDASGYKYAELLCTFNSTDSVQAERWSPRRNQWIPIMVYDQKADTKVLIMSPGAESRSYLINSPNIGKYRLRRLNLATASLANKFIWEDKWVRN